MKSIQDQFYDFEREFYNFEIEGEPCWHLFRMTIWQEIEKYARDAENPVANHPDLEVQKKGLLEKIKIVFNMLPNAILSNPYIKLKKNKKILCMGRYRVAKENDGWISRELNGVFRCCIEDINYIEKASFEEKHQYYCPTASARTDYFELVRLINDIFKKNRFTDKQIETLDRVADRAEKTFDVKLNRKYLIQKLQSNWNGYRTYCNCLDKLIKKINPQIVIEICHYNQTNFATTAIAHRYGIKVLELQHGTISKKHIAYNYPIMDNLTPDTLMAYGKAWVKNIVFPGEIQIIGNQYLEHSVENYSDHEDSNGILFISQGPYATTMVGLAVQLSKNDRFKKSGYRIIYKLHPSEYMSWREKCSELQQEGIEVIDNDEISLFDCFSNSKYQIGINSTALYEGIAFGLNTLIIKHKDADELFCVIDEKQLTFVNDADQIMDVVNGQEEVKIMANELWEKNSKDLIRKALEKIEL